jgi:hypothetical protein
MPVKSKSIEIHFISLVRLAKNSSVQPSIALFKWHGSRDIFVNRMTDVYLNQAGQAVNINVLRNDSSV